MASLEQAGTKKTVVSKPAADIVFVHGLGGDPVGTWTTNSKVFDWPDWLADEMPQFAVWRLGYESHLFRNKGTAYQDLAKTLLDQLWARELGQRPLAFIAHSLGGILVKQMLRAAEPNKQFQLLYHATAMIAFIGTPHTGSAAASLLRLFSLGSFQLQQLGLDDPSLRDLNEWFRDIALERSIKTAAYHETRRVKGFEIVGLNAADPGVAGCKVIGLPANHLDICKPTKASDQICRSIATHLRKTATLSKAILEHSVQSLESTEQLSAQESRAFASKEVRQSLIRYKNTTALALDDGIVLYSPPGAQELQIDSIEAHCDYSVALPPRLDNPTREQLLSLNHGCNCPVIAEFLWSKAKSHVPQEKKEIDRYQTKFGIRRAELPLTRYDEPLRLHVEPLSYWSILKFNRALLKEPSEELYRLREESLETILQPDQDCEIPVPKRTLRGSLLDD